MRLRNTTIYLLAALCIVFCLPVKPASAAGEGAAIRLSCTQAARVGERILVRVELTASETLAGAELGLHYDAARVKPVITDNSEGCICRFRACGVGTDVLARHIGRALPLALRV